MIESEKTMVNPAGDRNTERNDMVRKERASAVGGLTVVGVDIGSALGAALDNVPVGMGIGLALGLILGPGIDMNRHKSDRDQSD